MRILCKSSLLLLTLMAFAFSGAALGFAQVSTQSLTQVSTQSSTQGFTQGFEQGFALGFEKGLAQGLAQSLAQSSTQGLGHEINYESEMQAFIEEIDRSYPFFDLKNIGDDWTAAKKELRQRAKKCKRDPEFIMIVVDAVRVLRDGHLGIRETKVKMPKFPPEYVPTVSFWPATEGRVVLMYAPAGLASQLKTGTVVVKIDGINARQYLEDRAKKAWEKGGGFSSPQRARMFEYRIPFRGKRNETHTATCLVGGEERKYTFTCNTVAGGWPHVYNLPPNLKRVGRSFNYAKLESEVGYMHLRRVDASINPGIDQALAEHREVKGWIVDLRGNGGGGYDASLIERIKNMPQPVAVLIDPGCASAGETVARDFRTNAKARIFGTVTAGSSSSKRTWTFPSGIATLSLPTRSRWRGDGKPIEFNGIDPDVIVEPDPEELLDGKNSAIVKAEAYILELVDKLTDKKKDLKTQAKKQI